MAPGANACLAAADIDAAAAIIAGTKVLAIQLEVPMDSVLRAAELAGDATLILNCAPYRPVPGAPTRPGQTFSLSTKAKVGHSPALRPLARRMPGALRSSCRRRDLGP